MSTVRPKIGAEQISKEQPDTTTANADRSKDAQIATSEPEWFEPSDARDLLNRMTRKARPVVKALDRS
jgi:hypothetical protein